MKVKKLTDSTPFRVATLFVMLFGIYLIFIQLWYVTSPDYLPVKPTDNIVREAPDVDEWSDSRRLHTRFD